MKTYSFKFIEYFDPMNQIYIFSRIFSCGLFMTWPPTEWSYPTFDLDYLHTTKHISSHPSAMSFNTLLRRCIENNIVFSYAFCVWVCNKIFDISFVTVINSTNIFSNSVSVFFEIFECLRNYVRLHHGVWHRRVWFTAYSTVNRTSLSSINNYSNLKQTM